MSLGSDGTGQAAAAGFRPQIRIGEAIRRRGGARVSIVEGEEAAAPGAQWQPLTRVTGEEELAGAGLFEPRLLDIAERGEELVIIRALHVREELRVRKSISEHVERVDERLRRTEVEIEELSPAGPGADGARAEDRTPPLEGGSPH